MQLVVEAPPLYTLTVARADAGDIMQGAIASLGEIEVAVAG